MRLVECNSVGLVVTGVGLLADVRADLQPAGHADDLHPQSIFGAALDRLVDIAGVDRQKCAHGDDDFACTVLGRVVEASTRHLQRILQTRAAQRLAGMAADAQALDGDDVVVGIAAHFADAQADAVVHSEYAHLRDRVLLEELAHVVLGIAQRHYEPVARAVVLVEHGFREVEDEDDVAYNAALEGLRVLPQSVSSLLRHARPDVQYQRSAHSPPSHPLLPQQPHAAADATWRSGADHGLFAFVHTGLPCGAF